MDKDNDLPKTDDKIVDINAAKVEIDDTVDPAIDDVVEDIQHQESDELLKAKDEEIQKAFDPPKSRSERLKQWLKDVWDEPKYRWSIVASVVLLIAVVSFVPVTRYFVLNTVGVRANTSVKIVDDKTNQPLKNVSVEVRGKTVKTDENGVAKIEKIKLGSTKLLVTRVAYADIRQNITLGLGNNDLGAKQMTGVGARIQLKSVDWLSKQPIAKAEATYGESSAFSDDEGKIELVLDPSEAINAEVTVKAKNYLEKKIQTSMEDKSEKEAPLVVGYPHFFVSKRSGKYDLYQIQMDGSDEKLLLGGTGSEREQTFELSANFDHSFGAFVSQRENERNSDGYQLETLSLIDGEAGEVKKITNSEDINIVGWSDTHLIFVKIAAGASGQNASRHRLISYELSTGKETELASSNYFVNTVMMRDSVYYVPSDFYRSATRGLYRVKPDGSNKAAIIGEDTWSLFRTDVDQVTFQTADKWYRYTQGAGNPDKLSAPPNNPDSILFIENKDFSQALWKDSRDGKGALILRNMSDRKDQVIQTASGLDKALGWAGENHAVYRIATQSESADYIVSVDGGPSVKVRDVVNIGSFSQQQYY